MLFGFCLYLNLNAKLASTRYRLCTHFQVLILHQNTVGKSPQHYRHHLATCCKFGNR